MHLALRLVLQAIDELKNVDPFFGITFLVCKHTRLPVGRSMRFGINDAENDFLRQFYKPDWASVHYFHPFKTGVVPLTRTVSDLRSWTSSRSMLRFTVQRRELAER